MRTFLTLIIVGAITAPAAAQDRVRVRVAPALHLAIEEAQRERGGQRQDDRAEQTERVNRTFRVGQNGDLILGNIAGDIMISRGGGNDVTIEIVKTARGRDDADAKELLQLVQVEIAERNNRVEVRARYPQGEEMRRNNRRNVNVSVAYTVTAPAGIRVRATSISGSITAKDIKGELSAESVSGAVRVINGGRLATAKSISGNVEVSETDIDGNLNASTVSGSVVLRRVKARMIDVGAISGDVVMDDVDSPQVEGQTVSGSVRFGGPVVRGARYELTSHSGNLTVNLGGNAGFEVEATSFSGNIRSDFNFSTGGDTERARWRRSVRGVVGDGSAVLELTTFSGNIVIAKR